VGFAVNWVVALLDETHCAGGELAVAAATGDAERTVGCGGAVDGGDGSGMSF
jgi:hypothetical protein